MFAFAQLKPEQVQALLEPSAQRLRESYIVILTLLHDLLGRYSSVGNATVFLEAQEVTHLLYEALVKIRPLIPFSPPAIIRTRRSGLRFRQESALLIIDDNSYPVNDTTGQLMAKLRATLDFRVYTGQERNESIDDELESLAKTINEMASTNVKNAQMLRYLCEGAKDLSKETIRAVDNFLDALLGEYDLLRAPGSSDRVSPQTDKGKARPQVAKHARLRA
jgi:hypothetical protein